MALRLRAKGGSGSQNRGCGIGFGVFWILFSSIFVVVGLAVAWSSMKTRSWDEVPCTIDRFEITTDRNGDPPFQPDLVFRYQAAGQERTGTRLWNEKKGADDYEDLAKVRASLLMGPEGPLDRADGNAATCRVNPSDPDEAVLLHSPAGGFWFGLAFATFGGMFVLVGFGILKATPGSKTAKSARTSSETTGGTPGGLLGCGFFGIFALAGLGMLAGLVVPKALQWVEAKRWVPTPAEVVWSTVRSHSSDDGTTYSVDIFYRYEVDGIRHGSNRWNLMGGSSSGRSGKQAVVEAHPPGTEITCYVDASEPWRAVVHRDLGWWALFGLFPLPFLAVGLGGLWATFRRKKRRDEVKLVTSPEPLRTDRPDPGAGSFGSHRGKRVGMFVGTLFVAAFWNGIISVFLWQVWKGFSSGHPQWFLTVFMVPFVLVGVLLLVAVPYQLLAIFSPTYRLTLSSERLKPGERATLGWKRTGGGGQPRELTLWLIGREEAVYQRGTSRVTATSVFHERELFSTTTPPMMPGGRCDLPVPPDAVPTFRGQHNKIRWFVKLVVDVPWRPDVHEEHEIEVLPFTREEIEP